MVTTMKWPFRISASKRSIQSKRPTCRITGKKSRFGLNLTTLEDRCLPTSLAIMIVSGSNTIVVNDGGPGDIDGAVNNSISVLSGDGIPTIPGFHVVADAVITNTPGDASGALLQTSYAIFSTGTGGGAVTITTSATGFDQPPTSQNPLIMDSELNGNGTFAGTITGQAWADTTNTLFGMGPNSPGPQGPFNIGSVGGYASDQTETFNGSIGPYAVTSQIAANLAAWPNNARRMQEPA